MLFHEKYHTHYLHSRSIRTTRTTRILPFTTRTSGEYWTFLIEIEGISPMVILTIEVYCH